MRISAGQGVWIPPAQGRRHGGVVTEPGTVAFPLWLHASAGVAALSEPTRFAVPDGWQDWLIQHFNLMVTPLTGHGYAHEGLFDLLGRQGSGPSAPPSLGTGEMSDLEPPVMPRHGGARSVAEELVRDPSLDLTVEEWATRVLTSPRTLRRDFLADTGLTFDQWRLHCRLGAAIALLTAGYDVDPVAARVGFASRSGFTRAFSRQFGSTPYEFRRQLVARQATTEISHRATAARQADDLTRLMGASTAADTPRSLPATRTTPHANREHVLSWLYRGSGYLDVGEHRYERQRGDATWIPADLEHTTGLRENSISLPLGNAGTDDLRLTEPLRAQFSPAWDDYLMFCSISARSSLRPEGFDPRHILDLFAEQLAAQRALSVPMPTHPRSREAALSYLRSLGTYEAQVGAVSADVHRAFRDQTGMTFAGWRYAARMRVARELLASGDKPSAVGRRVGYAHLPNFSAAFSRFHGLSPRDYQERETESV